MSFSTMICRCSSSFTARSPSMTCSRTSAVFGVCGNFGSPFAVTGDRCGAYDSEKGAAASWLSIGSGGGSRGQAVPVATRALHSRPLRVLDFCGNRTRETRRRSARNRRRPPRCDVRHSACGFAPARCRGAAKSSVNRRSQSATMTIPYGGIETLSVTRPVRLPLRPATGRRLLAIPSAALWT